jgi:hypothetical protein
MSDRDYTLTITNEITTKGSNGNPGNPDNKDLQKRIEDNQNQNIGKSSGSFDPAVLEQLASYIQFQQMAGLIGKVGRAFGNDQLSELGQMARKASKYGMMAGRAVTNFAAQNYVGGAVAAAQLAIDISLDVVGKLNKLAREVAAKQNEADKEAYLSGVLAVDGKKVSVNWWSGRYEYGEY